MREHVWLVQVRDEARVLSACSGRNSESNAHSATGPLAEGDWARSFAACSTTCLFRLIGYKCGTFACIYKRMVTHYEWERGKGQKGRESVAEICASIQKYRVTPAPAPARTFARVVVLMQLGIVLLVLWSTLIVGTFSVWQPPIATVYLTLAQRAEAQAGDYASKMDHVNTACCCLKAAGHYAKQGEILKKRRDYQNGAMMYAKAARMYDMASEKNALVFMDMVMCFKAIDHLAEGCFVRLIADYVGLSQHEKRVLVHRNAAECYWAVARMTSGMRDHGQRFAIYRETLKHYKASAECAQAYDHYGDAAALYRDGAEACETLEHRNHGLLMRRASAQQYEVHAFHLTEHGDFDDAVASYRSAANAYDAVEDEESAGLMRRAAFQLERWLLLQDCGRERTRLDLTYQGRPPCLE